MELKNEKKMLAIITYDKPHKKTQDLIYRLILKGYKDLYLIVIPWKDRYNHVPVYKHRPDNPVLISTEMFCNNLQINYKKVTIDKIDNVLRNFKFDHVLIAGAGILPAKLTNNHKIINSHPGYLPNVKGLDALKWAIYQGQPIGVTTHYIDEKPDEGLLIERNIIPIYFEDTFHSIAQRVYENEIEMLVNSIDIIAEKKATFESLKDNQYKVNKRMIARKEWKMMYILKNLINKSELHEF